MYQVQTPLYPLARGGEKGLRRKPSVTVFRFDGQTMDTSPL
jgi:hypothetical protein